MTELPLMPYTQLSSRTEYSAMPLEQKLAECTKQLNLAKGLADRLVFRVTGTRKNPDSIDIIFEDNLDGITTDWIKNPINIPDRLFHPGLRHNNFYDSNMIAKYLEVVHGVLTQRSTYREYVSNGDSGGYETRTRTGLFCGVNIYNPSIGNDVKNLSTFSAKTQIYVDGGVYHLTINAEDVSAIAQGKLSQIKWKDHGGTMYCNYEPITNLDEVASIIISDVNKIFMGHLEEVKFSYESQIESIRAKIQEKVRKKMQEDVQRSDLEKVNLQTLKGKII